MLDNVGNDINCSTSPLLIYEQFEPMKHPMKGLIGSLLLTSGCLTNKMKTLLISTPSFYILQITSCCYYYSKSREVTRSAVYR